MQIPQKNQIIREKIDKIVRSILIHYGENESKKAFIAEICERLYSLKKSLKYDRFEQIEQRYMDVDFLFHYNEIMNRKGIEYFFTYYKPILKNLNFDIQTLNFKKV